MRVSDFTSFAGAPSKMKEKYVWLVFQGVKIIIKIDIFEGRGGVLILKWFFLFFMVLL